MAAFRPLSAATTLWFPPVALGTPVHGALAPYAGAQQGSSPDGLALSGDTLYVANAGNSDVAVVHLGAPDQVRGLIPTAWYPTGVAVAPDGAELYVLNAKGLGTGPNTQPGPNPYRAAISARSSLLGLVIATRSPCARKGQPVAA